MKVKKKKIYGNEFKQKVLNELSSGKLNVPAISRKYNVGQTTVYTWYRSMKKSKSAEDTSYLEKKLRILQYQLDNVIEERNVLKKAVRIFAKSS